MHRHCNLSGMGGESDNLVLALLREMRTETTSGFGRVEASLADHTGRLQRLETRTSSISLRLDEVAPGVTEDTPRIDRRLDEFDRRLRRLEDATPSD